MKLNPAVNQMLIFESIINDVTIITTVSIIIQAMTLKVNPYSDILIITRYLFVAVLFGVLFSFIWTLILARIVSIAIRDMLNKS